LKKEQIEFFVCKQGLRVKAKACRKCANDP